jgi:hypothetical protein
MIKLLTKLSDEAEAEIYYSHLLEFEKGQSAEYNLVLNNNSKTIDFTGLSNIKYIMVYSDNYINVTFGVVDFQTNGYFCYMPEPVFFTTNSDFEVSTEMTKNVNVKVKIICEDLVEMPDPEASVDTGTYATAQTVLLTSDIEDAIIMYTTDTTTPSKINGTEYSTSLTISTTTTVKFYAYKSGYEDSSVITKVYTITT